MHSFFHCLSPFSGFYSQPNPHSDDFFPIPRNTRLHNRFYMRIVTLLLPAPTQDSIDTTTFKSLISSSVYISIKISYSKKDISLSPLNTTFTLSAPHNNYPHPPI